MAIKQNFKEYVNDDLLKVENNNFPNNVSNASTEIKSSMFRVTKTALQSSNLHKMY